MGQDSCCQLSTQLSRSQCKFFGMCRRNDSMVVAVHISSMDQGKN